MFYNVVQLRTALVVTPEWLDQNMASGHADGSRARHSPVPLGNPAAVSDNEPKRQEDGHASH